MEIRTIGQQYTILVDGKIINQFDNSIPKITTRAGDPPTMARQFAQGYLGLQTHGGNDRISYREIQVKEFAAGRRPGQHGRPVGHRLGLPGQRADLQPRHVERRGRQPALRQVVPLEQDRRRRTRASARRAPPTWATSRTPADPRYGTQALTWTRLAAGRRGRHVHADGRGRRQGHPLRRQRQQRRRDGVEDGAGPGDPLRDQRHPGRRRHRPGHAEPDARHAGDVRRLHPGRRSATTTPRPRPT